MFAYSIPMNFKHKLGDVSGKLLMEVTRLKMKHALLPFTLISL